MRCRAQLTFPVLAEFSYILIGVHTFPDILPQSAESQDGILLVLSVVHEG
jgi:hypothetical protein